VKASPLKNSASVEGARLTNKQTRQRFLGLLKQKLKYKTSEKCRKNVEFDKLFKSFFPEFSRAIREAHHSMHMKRKKFERGTNVFTLPLPWRPGWRNLISGRAMGGNRLERFLG
jgi:hypothetical protein